MLSCNTYRFPVFSTAVSMIVLNPKHDKILLIKQYQKPDFILVAGYINKGESAEETVMREIREELNLEINSILYNSSRYYEASNTLMINFICTSTSENVAIPTNEVDDANWFSLDEARQQIKPHSLAKLFLEYYLDSLT